MSLNAVGTDGVAATRSLGFSGGSDLGLLGSLKVQLLQLHWHMVGTSSLQLG